MAKTKSILVRQFRGNILVRLYREVIIDSIVIVKNHGFKELAKRRGWKFLAAVFLYYLVRDSILYILVPFLIGKGILSF